MTVRDQKPLAIFLLIFTSTIWGSSFILIKKGLLVFSVEQVALLRVLFAYSVLLPIALFHFKKYIKNYGIPLFISGITGNLIPAFLFAKAQTQLDSGITGVLNSLTPLFTLILGVLFFKFKLLNRHIIGILLGLAGSVSLSLINKTGNWGSVNFYVVFVIIASMCYGFNVNYVKKHLQKIPSIRLTGMALFFIGPPAMIYLFMTDFTTRISTLEGAWTALGYLAILGIVNTAFALVLFWRLLKITTPVVASSVTYIIPIVALIIGLWDGEQIFLLHILGMALIIAGVYIVNRR